MKNSRSKIITVLMLLLLALAGCAQPDTEEIPNKTVLPEKKVVARIYLPNEGPQTRTILPGKLGQADHYTLTFTKAGAEPVVQTGLRPTLGVLEIVGLEKGDYDVNVEGFNTTGTLIYTGASTEKLSIVDFEHIAAITVMLNPTINEQTTGNIQVTFDWTSLVGTLDADSTSSANKLKAKGPISTAIEEGTLKFVIYTAEIGQPLVQRGEPIVWTEAEGANRKTCLFTGIPTGKNIAVAFSILDKNDNTIVDRKYSITAQVFTDQTSYWNGAEDHVLHIASNMDKWYSNIANVQIEYPIESDLTDIPTATVENSVIFTWDARTVYGEPIYKAVNFDVIDKATGLKVGDTITFVPEARKPNTITVTGLEPRKEYYLNSEAISLGGKHSNVFQWKKDADKGFTTKVEVESITINNDIDRAIMATGDSFNMTASITPADASYSILTWAPTVEDTVYISKATTSIDEEVTITANKPGITRIRVKTNDPKVDKSNVTANEISIRLAQPKNATAAFERNEGGQTVGIRVDWTPVDYAEQYEIYRKVDSDEFGSYPYATVTTSDMNPVHSYLDENIRTGSSYEYKIVAKAPTVDALYKGSNPSYSATSLESAATAAITSAKPTIELTPIDFKQAEFDLTDNEKPLLNINDIPVIAIDLENPSRTLTLTNPVPGMENGIYTWYVNGLDGTAVKSGLFNEAKTIEINKTLAGLDVGEDGVQELTLAVNANGETQSILIHFTVITDPVEGITITTVEDRFSTAMDQVAIKAEVYPSTATVSDIRYKVVSGGDIAVIDPKTGALSFAEMTTGGDMIIEVSSVENPSITAQHRITVYKPTVTTVDNLVVEVNKVLGKLLDQANQNYFKKDWWYGTAYEWKDVPGVSIIANHTSGGTQYTTGGIRFNNYKPVLPGIGTVTMNTETNDPNGNRLSIFAAYEGAAGYLGDDRLQFIGYDGTSDIIRIELPYHQGTVTIKYNKVDVLSGSASGSYTVTFSNPIYTAAGTIVDTPAKPIDATLANRPSVPSLQ